MMSHLVHFLVSLFLISTCTMYADSSDLPTCPIWTYPSPPHNECVCGNSLRDAIICNSETLTVQLTVTFFCLMIFNSNGVNTTLLGTCPYRNTEILPKNISQIFENSSLCSFTIERDSFAENVQKTTLSQLIPITLDVLNARITTIDG